MELINFRKETSEGSDPDNWAKKILAVNAPFHFESIEGCNQNDKNLITHLMERARIDITGSGNIDNNQILTSIKTLEADDNRLQRKINFAHHFGLPLTYVLYCNENENVFCFKISSINEIALSDKFNSYQDFSNWIQSIKVWKSKEKFREEGLPDFDKKLRLAGCAWPTNIDCFVCNLENKPIAILEFQNANDTKVANHCNNDFFLCKMSSTNEWGYPVYHDDIRRWTSQEILRVQSSLKFLIITWSAKEKDFVLKEVEVITIPHFPETDGKPDWKYINAYKMNMNKYSNKNDTAKAKSIIEQSFKTFNLIFADPIMNLVINTPPLAIDNKTFPLIYYRSKELIKDNQNVLPEMFTKILNQ